MTLIKILTTQEKKIFDTPPVFNSEDRKKYFKLDALAKKTINSLHNKTNRACFLLSLGYFKGSYRFFSANKFYPKDVDYVTKQLGLKKSAIELDSYKKTSAIARHKKMILEMTGFVAFEEKDRGFIGQEAAELVAKQVHPKQIFIRLLEYLQIQRVEFPSYNFLAEEINKQLKSYEEALIDRLQQTLQPEAIELLSQLIEDKQNQYRIILFKKINQSVRPGKIKKSVQSFFEIKQLHEKLKPALKALKLSLAAIRYYAGWACKARSFQLLQFAEPYKRYLYLMAFVCDQYYLRQDILVEILLSAVKSYETKIEKEEKENSHQSKKTTKIALKVLNNSRKNYKKQVEQIKALFLLDIPRDDLFTQIQKIAFGTQEDTKQEEIIAQVEKELAQSSTAEYFVLLESRSRKLQNRVAEIIKHLEFNAATSEKKIITAIDEFKKNNGILNKNTRLDFLNKEEQKALLDKNGKLRLPLYKVLLFMKVAAAIKSGNLCLVESYKYLSVEEYLINKPLWEAERQALLKKAGLNLFFSAETTLTRLKEKIYEVLSQTNKQIEAGKNPYVRLSAQGKFTVKTPAVEKKEQASLRQLFSPVKYIPSSEILSDVNKATNFLDFFEHYSLKHKKSKPSAETFFAGIIAYGCNLGVNKVGKTAKGINLESLINTVNWYFSLANINAANSKIVEFINRLPLTKLQRKKDNLLHTASDGQKFGIAVDSLNANYSFKYFGKGKGVTVYSFIDDANRLFYSTVISSSVREAAYVLDGLLHNEVVKSDIHSTDTHGYTEAIFATTHLLGISFAPRICKLKDSALYHFKNILSDEQKEKYQIIPKNYINEKIIKDNWDNILRFIATIKLKETTAAQIFHRLNSYSQQHPLYQALKELGRIIKTIFLLTYLNDLDLRQTIEAQLNKVELSHLFSKAIFFGNCQEFQFETKLEQEIAAGCKRLIQNALVLWNYLYLSQQLVTVQEEKNEEILAMIRNGSVISWHHVNFHGIYDFSKYSPNRQTFNLSQILNLKIA